MTTLNLGQPRARHTRREIPTHRFAVGDIVRLKDGFARPRTTVTTYQITGVLPPKGTSPQYRVRNHEERHERVATQDDLERISLAQTGVSLEGLFEMAKGQKRSNCEIRKPKQGLQS